MYAVYQIYAMALVHDSRVSLGAKGLSGEGYQGHVFWDTEIYAMPFYVLNCPEIARKMLIYRHQCLGAAREKAQKNGYKGAQYPWESAGITDGEMTPRLGNPDLRTGERDMVWTGLIEHHISADVAYGVWLYYTATQDRKFMEKYGCEILFDTADFWVSILEKGPDGRVHICDVIGPDEYKIHVDDNAYTNHMAAWNLDTAVRWYREMQERQPGILENMEKKRGCPYLWKEWEEALSDLYLPGPEKESGVIPQDASYLKLRQIEIEKYKWKTASVLKEYSPSELNEIQVSKQADVLVLFSLLKNRFSEEILAKNWDYYETRTVHDSSLSPSVFCVTACRCGREKEAEEMFRHAVRTDLGDNPHSCDDGLHMASLAGIWQCVVMGFGGVSISEEGALHIDPVLPSEWDSLGFHLIWHGAELEVKAGKDFFEVHNLSKAHKIYYYHKGEKQEC